MNDEVLLREMSEINLLALVPGDIVIPHLFFDEAETFARHLRDRSFASYNLTTVFVIGWVDGRDIACFVKIIHRTAPVFSVITVSGLAVNVRDGLAAKWMVVLRSSP